MISRRVRSTCPKTGLNEAENDGRGEADGSDRAAWLVLGAGGAGEGGAGSAVSSSCILRDKLLLVLLRGHCFGQEHAQSWLQRTTQDSRAASPAQDTATGQKNDLGA